MEAIIFIGIQASGKSTFYKDKFFKTHIRLNLDMLRTRHREKLLVQACLEAKQSFVIDNTNPTVEDRSKYIKLAKDHEFQVIGYYFEPNFEEAIGRNSKRSGKEKIPIVGIKSTINRLEPPCFQEGFDQLYILRIVNNEFIVSDYKQQQT